MTRLNDGNDLEIATEEDFGIVRDEEGELQPVQQRIPGTDKAIKCIPLTPGERTKYSDVLDEDSAETSRVAELWNEHITEGIGSSATSQDVEAMPSGLVAGINQALKNSSGEQVFLAVREQVNQEMQEHIKIAQQMDDEFVEKILNSVTDNEEQS